MENVIQDCYAVIGSAETLIERIMDNEALHEVFKGELNDLTYKIAQFENNHLRVKHVDMLTIPEFKENIMHFEEKAKEIRESMERAGIPMEKLKEDMKRAMETINYVTMPKIPKMEIPSLNPLVNLQFKENMQDMADTMEKARKALETSAKLAYNIGDEEECGVEYRNEDGSLEFMKENGEIEFVDENSTLSGGVPLGGMPISGSETVTVYPKKEDGKNE